MKILKVLLLPIIVYAAVQSNVIAQTLPPFECETDFNEDLSGPINHADGRHITAHDTLRILVVFAKFADDTNSEPSYWPDDGFPSFATNTGPEAFIDGTATQNSNHLINMTNYFREMSMGKFIVLGDVETVTAPKSADQYTSRHEANRDILQSLDANVNYSNYDNWTRDSLYTHTKNPDGKVDMIAMIWRDFHSHLLNFDGEASLQSGPDLQVDNGNTIIGFSFGTGSGFNVQTRTNVVRRLFQDTVHEMAHWLVGGPHPYSGGPIHRVWSMLQGSFISAASANTYEREKLGWIDVIKITQPMQNQPIGDFITTGNAFKYKVPNGDPEEFIYIENRQKESIYDDATHNSDDKGIFILHQRGSYSNSHNIRHVSSDGNWYWDHVEPFFASDPCCGEQPVFAKGEPNPINGQNYGTKITGGGKNDWLWGYKDENEFVSVAANYQGLPFIGAWNNQNRLLFAPNTNPMPRTWSGDPVPFAMEVVNQSGSGITVNFYTDYDPYTITENTTWDGQIFLDQNTKVENNATLTILPGTTVYVAENVHLDIRAGQGGTLISEGTEQDPIRFLRTDPTKAWKTIYLNSSAGNSIKWTLFDGGETNLTIASKNNTIEHSTFRNATHRNIDTWHNNDGSGNSSATLSYVLIENSATVGIVAQYTDLDISNTTIQDNTQAGLYIVAGTVNPFHHNIVTGNGSSSRDGIEVKSSGTLLMRESLYLEGHNEVSGNGDDQISNYGSLEVGQGYNGENSIYGSYDTNKKYVENHSGSTVDAVNTWWGVGPARKRHV